MSLPPGSTIGFFGGGQLGRMGAMAARAMGYHVVVVDPAGHCAAAGVVDRVIVGDFNDARAAHLLGEAAQVISYEIEKIGDEALVAAASQGALLRPDPTVLHMVQDRARQKEWLRVHNFPTGPVASVTDAASLADAIAAVGTPARLKTCAGGYDGRGQASVPTPEVAEAAWTSLGQMPCVLERELTLEAELSVMVSRRPQGELQVFPVSHNWHEHGVLKWSVIPADLPDTLQAEARALGTRLAMALNLEGMLAVEMFATASHGLVINEMAARPHNTFHTTQQGCAVSQFEQWIRAICDVPLAQPRVHRPSALANLLGDLWSHQPPDFTRAWAMPEVQVHLYGKEPRPGRKMGHLLAAADTSEDALRQVQRAYAALTQ